MSIIQRFWSLLKGNRENKVRLEKPAQKPGPSKLGKKEKPRKDIIVAAQGKLSNSELKQILSKLKDIKYVQLENEAEQEIISFSNETDPAQFKKGRAFGEKSQLQWVREFWFDSVSQKKTSGWRVVYIGTRGNNPIIEDEPKIVNLNEAYEQQTSVMKLWGERKEHQEYWMEPRLSKKLVYPLAEPHQFVGIKVRTYHKNGGIEFVQYENLVEWSNVEG